MIFLEPKRLYNGPFDGHHDRPVTPWSKHELGEVPDGHYHGAARQGGDPPRRARRVTVLAYGTMVYVAQAAAEETGIDAEIIDLRTLLPLDLDTIVASVEEDRPLRGRARGDADLRLRRRACGAGAGALLLPSGGAGRARRPAGTRPIRMRRNGTISPARRASAGRSRNDGGVSMGEHVIKLPDVGEGVAEAELVEWHVKVGDLVREDAVLAAVMTDKATVEIPSPVDGEVLWLGAEIGDTVAVGSPLSG